MLCMRIFPEEAHDRHVQATRSSRSSISISLPAAWMWLGCFNETRETCYCELEGLSFCRDGQN